jgi:hypothetical protein
MMPDYTSPLARIFGFLGAVAVALSTLVAWYDFEVIVEIGRIAHVFDVPVDLWSYDSLAAALILAGGIAAMALLAVPVETWARWTSVCAGLLGLGVAGYAVYRCFDKPDLGIGAVSRAGVDARTFVDAGAFLAVVGGAMIVLGSLVVMVEAHRAASTGERAVRVHAPATTRGRAGMTGQ